MSPIGPCRVLDTQNSGFANIALRSICWDHEGGAEREMMRVQHCSRMETRQNFGVCTPTNMGAYQSEYRYSC
jgi:hypothetical protein